MRHEKIQKIKINNLEINTHNQKNYNSNNVPFYRKSLIQNNKTSFYYHKKETSPSYNLAQNQNNYNCISGYKKKIELYNNSNENTNPSSKIKIIDFDYSKNRNSKETKLDDAEKYNLNKSSVSPFCLQSNNSYKEYIINKTPINNNSQNSKNRIQSNRVINYNIPNKNLTLENCKKRNRSFANLEINYKNNDKSQKEFILINKDQTKNPPLYKNKKNKTIKILEKTGINFTFKNTSDKESIDLLSQNMMKDFHKESLNRLDNKSNSTYINTNNYIINNNLKIKNNNFIKIAIDNSNIYNKEINDNNKNNIFLNDDNIKYNNNTTIETISKKNNYYNNNNYTNYSNADNKADNDRTSLSKGKIIKFKYNGTEFFFQPVHNKTQCNFYKHPNNKKYINENIIKATKIIQKWWKQIVFTKVLFLKNKINFLNNIIKRIIIRYFYNHMKLAISHIKKVIIIQKKWREFLYNKKETISNHYEKNETYGYDNSNRKNYFDNFFINTSEFTNINEENTKSRVVYNNIIHTKNNILLNDLSGSNSHRAKLQKSNSKNDINYIIKAFNNRNSFFTKQNYKKPKNKIILIQQRIKKFLERINLNKKREIYKNIFINNQLIKNGFGLLKISSEITDNFFSGCAMNGKAFNKHLDNLTISKHFFTILNQPILQIYNIIKNENIIFKGIIPENKSDVLNIEKINEFMIIFKPQIKYLQSTHSSLSISPKIPKKFEQSKMSIWSNICLNIKPQKNNNNKFDIDKNKINIFLFNENSKGKEENLKELENDYMPDIIKHPLLKTICFVEKVHLSNRLINNIKYLQIYYRKHKINEKKEIQKRFISEQKIITKEYKDNSLNISNIVKIQKKFKHFLKQRQLSHFKPNNKILYISKKYMKQSNIHFFEKLKKNNPFIKFNKISKNHDNTINKSISYFNNKNKILKKGDFKNINDISKYNTINNLRKSTKERNNIFINDNEDKKNEIKILNTKLHKNSLRYGGIDNINIKNSKNFRFNLNKRFINIESLPSVNSLKINSECNDICNDQEYLNAIKNEIYKYKLNNNIISIETLESKESKSKFKESLIYKNKRVTTEEGKYKNSLIPYETENENKYFYTENDIARFSFSNGDVNFLSNSIVRTNTKKFYNLKKIIYKFKIKLFCFKMKKMIHQINLFIFIQLLSKRIHKNLNKFVFNTIFKRKNTSSFYDIIRKHIGTYITIMSSDKKDKNICQNDLIQLIQKNIFNKYFLNTSKNKFLFLTDEQEKNLIETDLFINNDKDLINYFFFYYKVQYKLLEDNYYNLIQFRLIKEPLYIFNIFSITKYMEELYYNITHENICKACFCKTDENCSLNCNCHIKLNNSINLINKIKNKISHNKSFNMGRIKNEEISDILDISNQKEKTNIKITIKKIKRGSADNTRSRLCNNEDSGLCSSNDIDIFQKMNTGIKSLISKVKINKAFKDFSQNKKNKQIKNSTKIDRTFTEISDNNNMKKKNSIPYIDNKYNTIFCNIKDDIIPKKKVRTLKGIKNIFDEQ